MSDDLSLWGAVAQRYAEARELRADELTGRFTARFDAATLILRKSNGVERAVDFDEFRAAWRIISLGGADVTLRLVSANGAYLRAVREDLIEYGVAPDAELDASDADDLGTAERNLLAEATRWSRPATPSGAPTEAGQSETADSIAPDTLSIAEALGAELAALEVRLDAEQKDKETALRENARLLAAVEMLEERLRLEADGVAKLETAIARLEAQPTRQSPGIGVGGDITTTLVVAATAMVRESQAPEELRTAASVAIKLIQQDPPSAVTKARVVTELLVKQEWSEVFAADPNQTRKLFGDYARELDGQAGVDVKLLSVKRTLYRVASPGAHELVVSARRAAIVVLVLCAVLNAYKPRT